MQRKLSVGMIGAIAAAALAGTLRGVNYASSGYARFREAAAKRMQKAATGHNMYPTSINGGQRRKSAMRRKHLAKYGRCRMGRYHA